MGESDPAQLVINDGLPPGWDSDDEGIEILGRYSAATGMPTIGLVQRGGQNHQVRAPAQMDVVVGLNQDTGKIEFLDPDIDLASSQREHFLDIPSVEADQIDAIDRASTVGEPRDAARRRPRPITNHTYKAIR